MSERRSAAAGDHTPAPILRAKPLRAEVYKKQLNREEQDVILAMLEIGDSTGQELHIRIPRIAAWAKMEERTVQRALWGDHRTHPNRPIPNDENGKRLHECPYCKGLVQRRVLQELAPASRKKRSPATYRLNLEILDDCAAVRRYIDQAQFGFLGTKKQPTVAPTSDPRSHQPVTHGRTNQRPMVADLPTHGRTDSKAFDSGTGDSRAIIPLAAPVCRTCGGSGEWEHPGHPGEYVYCHCLYGQELQRSDQQRSAPLCERTRA